ncbi:hypothetical protein MMC06_005948 [Schaereria dolodes]|nr:hypothetical protein [Schaereria dolodes]
MSGTDVANPTLPFSSLNPIEHLLNVNGQTHSEQLSSNGTTSPSSSPIDEHKMQEPAAATIPLLSRDVDIIQTGSRRSMADEKPRKTESGTKPEIVTWMSLPHKDQLFILAMCRLSEPLSNTCLLPYLFYLIRSFQAQSGSAADISRHAGIVVSLFALAQFVTSMPWARVADTMGRKSSIMMGLTLTILANLGFGFAKSIPALMFWRVLAGIGNGNVGVMRTMTAEIVKERKYQSRAFLVLPLVFNTGMILGLALGGCLADPVTNMQWVFGPQGLLNFAHDPEGVVWTRTHPYALPAIVNAAALAFSLLLAIGGLRETLPSKAGKRDPGILLGNIAKRVFKRVFLRSWRSGYSAIPVDELQDASSHDISEKGLHKPSGGPPAGSKPLSSETPTATIWTRDVLYMLVSFALLPLHNATFMQVFPLFLSTPHTPKINATDAQSTTQSPIFFDGGLSLPSSTIGLWLSTFGVMGIFLQLLIYPRLQARYGTLSAYRLALYMFPLAYLLAPYLSLFAPDGFGRWVGIAFILFVQVTARTFAIPSSVILLTNVAPRPSALSRIHGAGNMISSLARAVGPAIGGWTFAWGIERGCVGFVWWTYLMLVAVAAILESYKLREKEGLGKEKEKERQVTSKIS